MARRRSSWSRKARVAYGLSTGAQQFFQQMMRDIAQQRNAERIAERQEAADARTLARQGEMLERQTAAQRRNALFEKLPEKAATMEPDALQAYIDAGGGLFEQQYPSDFVGTGEQFRERDAHQQATQGLIESMRPLLRRKIDPVAGKRIKDADSPEELDTNALISEMLATDSRVMPADDVPGMRVGGLAPEAYEYVAQAEDKAHALRTKPGERLTVKGDDGSERVITPSQQDFASGGIQISPSAEQQGTLAGQQKTAEIAASGDALAQQAGREGFARESGAINAKLANAQRLIDFDTQQALAKLKVLGQEVDVRKAAEAVAEARESANRSAPAVDQLQKTWLLAQPAIAHLIGSSVIGRPALGFQEDWRPSSTLPQNVKNYQDLVDAVRPLLARAFGQTGNPALMEQQWAKYVPNFSDALNPDDALMKLARLEALMSSQVAIAQAAREKGVLQAADIDAIVQPRIQSAYEALVEMSNQVSPTQRPITVPSVGTQPLRPGTTIEFNLTPNGLVRVPGGG